MKKGILLFITLVMATILQAQYCSEVAGTKMKKIQDACSSPEFKNKQAYDSLKKEMFSTFEIIESCVSKNNSYEQRSKVNKINLYFSLAELAGQTGQYDEMLKHIEAMERILPSSNSLSISAISSFYIDGQKFTSNVPNDYTQTLYYQIIERRVNYFYFATKNYQKVIEWYDKIKAAPSSFKPASLEALLYADALYKSGKSTETYFPAMADASVLAGALWAKKEEHDSAQINNRSLMLRWFEREMYEYNKERLNKADPNGVYRMKAAHGLWDIDERSLAKKYAQSASQAGYIGLSDGFWYLDIVAGNESEHMIAALEIIDRSANQLNETQMRRLLPLTQQYRVLSLEEKIKQQLRRIANLRRRSTISLYPAIELVGLPVGHVPASLNLRTGRIVQEFMFDYIWGAKTKYRFGRAFAKGDKGDRYEFSGWSAGYALTGILGREFQQGNKKKGRSKFFAPTLGIDFRYSNWNFDPMTSNIVDENDAVLQSNVTVNATTNRYEACFRGGIMAMTRYVTFEYYFGLGVGYRALKTQEGFNVEDSRFSDPRLDANRWNKVYMPIRLGLKVGFNLM